MIVIRKATASDVDAFCDIKHRAINEKCIEDYSAEQLTVWTQDVISERLINDIVTSFYVSELAGKVIGSGKVNLKTGEVDAIFVDPDFFGKGAAKLMLIHLETLAKQHGISSLSLESTLNAANFYRACGFIGDEVSTYHCARGISLDCVIMKKQLTESALLS